jgi:hypothetical protein
VKLLFVEGLATLDEEIDFEGGREMDEVHRGATRHRLENPLFVEIEVLLQALDENRNSCRRQVDDEVGIPRLARNAVDRAGVRAAEMVRDAQVVQRLQHLEERGDRRRIAHRSRSLCNGPYAAVANSSPSARSA